MGKFSSDDILNIRHNYNKEVESKTAYCKRLAEKYNVDKTMIRQILNNQKYYDPNYTPYMPGGSNKVTKEDVDKIRDDYLKYYNGKRTIEDFIDDLQYRYNIGGNSIRNIIHNKTWKDENYDEPELKTGKSFYVSFTDLSNEIWIGLKYNDVDYSDYYKVSNYGRIFNKSKDSICSFSKSKDGYYRCGIYIPKGIKTVILVHRAVMCSFTKMIPGKPEINHKDCNKLNNYIGTPENNFNDGNLEWCTSNENIEHAISMGQINRKLTDEQVRYIRSVYIKGDKQYGVTALARKFDVGNRCISNVVNYESYKHIK